MKLNETVKIKLHDYLNTMSPDTGIKLYDNEGNMLYDGFSGEITKTIMFTNWHVDGHVYDGKDMFIWIQ